MPYELFLALRYLRFHRGRTFLSVVTLISVAGVTVGTAALVIALSLMAGFLEDVRERIHSGSAHLTVMHVETETFDAVEPLIERTLAIDGVRAAGPVLYSPAMVTPPGAGTPRYAEVLGIDPERHTQVILGGDGAAGPFAALREPTESGRAGILLGDDLADRLGAIEGDAVRVVVPQLTMTPWAPVPRSKVFEVVGTYHSDHFQEDSQRAYIGIEAAGRLLRATGRATWVEVRLDELSRLAEKKRGLRSELGGSWLVIDLIEQNRDLLKALNMEKLTLFLAIGLIVVVAALNIVSTLILMVTDKIKEIGTLSAMGATSLAVATVFILQGLVIGAVGTISGLGLGAALAWWLDRYRIIQLNPDVYYLTHIPFTIQPMDLLFVGLSALLISLGATVYPALKAARLDPVEAIRYE